MTNYLFFLIFLYIYNYKYSKKFISNFQFLFIFNFLNMINNAFLKLDTFIFDILRNFNEKLEPYISLGLDYFFIYSITNLPNNEHLL